MRRECRERFPRHRLHRKPLVSDPNMHHDTCVTHVPWCMSGSLTCGGGENVPAIPGACATRNFTYLARGPWKMAFLLKEHGTCWVLLKYSARPTNCVTSSSHLSWKNISNDHIHMHARQQLGYSAKLASVYHMDHTSNFMIWESTERCKKKSRSFVHVQFACTSVNMRVFIQHNIYISTPKLWVRWICPRHLGICHFHVWFQVKR